jgi:hypothetical protein
MKFKANILMPKRAIPYVDKTDPECAKMCVDKEFPALRKSGVNRRGLEHPIPDAAMKDSDRTSARQDGNTPGDAKSESESKKFSQATPDIDGKNLA